MSNSLLLLLIALFWFSAFLLGRLFWLNRRILYFMLEIAIVAEYEKQFEKKTYEENGDYTKRIKKYWSFGKMFWHFWMWDLYKMRDN